MAQQLKHQLYLLLTTHTCVHDGNPTYCTESAECGGCNISGYEVRSAAHSEQPQRQWQKVLREEEQPLQLSAYLVTVCLQGTKSKVVMEIYSSVGQG